MLFGVSGLLFILLLLRGHGHIKLLHVLYLPGPPVPYRCPTPTPVGATPAVAWGVAWAVAQATRAARVLQIYAILWRGSPSPGILMGALLVELRSSPGAGVPHPALSVLGQGQGLWPGFMAEGRGERQRV